MYENNILSRFEAIAIPGSSMESVASPELLRFWPLTIRGIIVRLVLISAMSVLCLTGGCKKKSAWMPEHTFGMEMQSSNLIIITLTDSGEKIELAGAEVTPILDAFIMKNLEFSATPPGKETQIATVEFRQNHRLLDTMKYYPNSILTCRSQANDRLVRVRLKDDPIAPLLSRN